MGLGAVTQIGDPEEGQLLFHLHVRIQPCSSRQAKGGAFEPFVASVANPLPKENAREEMQLEHSFSASFGHSSQARILS